MQRIYLYLFAFIAVILFAGGGVLAQSPTGDAGLTADEKAWITEHPVLKSTNELDWAPLDFMRDGKAIGYSVDYLNLVAEKVGLEIEYINGFTWQVLLDKLKNREIDISQSIFQSADREEYLNFTKPYLELPTVYFGREGSKRITGIEDLQGLRIGGVQGDITLGIYKENFPDLTLVEFDSTFHSLKALSAGSIDVHTDILSVSRYIIRTNMLPGLEVIGDTFYPETENIDKIRLAARNDWPELIAILEKGMAAITEPELRELSDKWQAEQAFTKNIDIGLTRDEREWLLDHKVINVVTDPAVAPLEFIDQNGEISGISGAYLEKISAMLNVEFKWVGNKNWAEGMDRITAKEAEVVSNIVATPERQENFFFTDSFMKVTAVIFARQGNSIAGNLDGLAGRKVTLVSGFATIDYISKEFPLIEIIEVIDVSEALRLVSSGVADAYIGGIPITSNTIAMEGYTNIVVAGETPFTGENAIGIRSDLPLLASAMQKAMQSITPLEKAAISREWLAIKIENQVDYGLVRNVVGVAIVILILILIWNNSLRKEVARRKTVERKLIFSQERAQTAQADAEAANIAKSNFLANMSHEIRTPLNAIIGFSDAMLSGVGGLVKLEKHKEYLNDIKYSGEHLATVIKDILDLSKIEAGKWRLDEDEFSLDICINDAIKILQPDAEKNEVEVIYQPDDIISSLNIFGDIHAIKRIFINLLSNSIKFTREKGKVEFLIERLRNGQVSIEISDNGIGIPKDRLEHVLSPFEQNHEHYDLNDKGTGLGLPIVENLIKLHSGKFSLTSEVGVGTSAIFTIPTSRVIS